MVDALTFVPIIAGAMTALIAVFVTVYIQRRGQDVQLLRAMQTELAQNEDRLRELATLLADDLQRQQIDLPIRVPADSRMEIRYVVSFPGSLSTAAFERLSRSTLYLRLDPELRSSLFAVYDTIDRINRLREHRERIHFEDAGNVHIVIDPSELAMNENRPITEADLPVPTRERLDRLRETRRSMQEINRSILRLAETVASLELVDELEMQGLLAGYRGSRTDAEEAPCSTRCTIPEMRIALEERAGRSLWSRIL